MGGIVVLKNDTNTLNTFILTKITNCTYTHTHVISFLKEQNEMTIELESKIGSTPIVNKSLVNTATYTSFACMQEMSGLGFIMVMHYKKIYCYVCLIQYFRKPLWYMYFEKYLH